MPVNFCNYLPRKVLQFMLFVSFQSKQQGRQIFSAGNKLQFKYVASYIHHFLLSPDIVRVLCMIQHEFDSRKRWQDLENLFFFSQPMKVFISFREVTCFLQYNSIYIFDISVPLAVEVLLQGEFYSNCRVPELDAATSWVWMLARTSNLDE